MGRRLWHCEQYIWKTSPPVSESSNRSDPSAWSGEGIRSGAGPFTKLVELTRVPSGLSFGSGVWQPDKTPARHATSKPAGIAWRIFGMGEPSLARSKSDRIRRGDRAGPQ